MEAILNHKIETMTNIITGALIKILELELLLVCINFINNLIASVKGWRIPINLTLLGPTRS